MLILKDEIVVSRNKEADLIEEQVQETVKEQ